jgi:hypothetical protein
MLQKVVADTLEKPAPALRALQLALFSPSFTLLTHTSSTTTITIPRQEEEEPFHFVWWGGTERVVP